MAIKQISIFVENSKGKLADAIKIIADANINIRALSLADTEDFGILRLIVSDADKANELLREDSIVKINSVIAVKMDDIEGALYKILYVLEEAEINVDYSYAFTAPKDKGAYVVFRVDDIETAEKILGDNGFEFLSDNDI